MPALSNIGKPKAMRLTRNFVAVATTLMEQPFGRFWGYDLTKQSGVRSGALYPMLAKFLELGWLTDGWEQLEALPAGRHAGTTN